ncbi:hypothetical protein EDI_092590 [Entamoeba dispar SAW760]|uniref:Uncharacterized protein n=1 Tax=Entamoeba dispar (strain ATCC PRA-260 / SAW760) TaxID=370354 RepID=B0ED51_ENTDS|nr:uncharacterized protein EDI_092590 [Entamoeba dispar SAW760]EDR27468.1 hypothetical protein EDI_092590 [Entamoeba dispar SAW760]|eukprot:EDR27468.1 hypothetical protein EDI_092590 [Entamoeba dispar SAW760]
MSSCNEQLSLSTINPRAKRIESEHALKNDICYQQAFLILLLNQYLAITLKKQSKKCTITSPTPLVDSLIIDHSVINLREFTKKQCELISGKEYLSNKTVQRRFSKNKQYFVQNFLIDCLREFNYQFDSKYSKPTSKTLRLERIRKVFFNSKYLCSQNEIQSIGKEVNSYLASLLQKEKSVTIEKNDVILAQFKQFTEKNILNN